MSLQSDLVALIGPIFAGRCYPNVAPDAPVKPYATYFRVASSEDVTLDDNGGIGNASNTRIQIDVWADSYGDAQAKAALVETALKGWGVENIIESEQDMYEPETKLHRVMLDVSVWHL